jgi:hypothetical protein
MGSQEPREVELQAGIFCFDSRKDRVVRKIVR